MKTDQHRCINILGCFVGRIVLFLFILFPNTACLYLGDIEELDSILPLEFDISYPSEDETLFLNPNTPNQKAIVFVWYSGSRTNISFTWLIRGETLPAEYVPDENELKLGSIVDLGDSKEHWDGEDLTVYVSILEPRNTITRSWPIVIQEGN